MKSLFTIFSTFGFLLIFLASCNSDDYQTIQSVDRLKIDSVKVPQDTMNVLSIQTIKTYSTYSSNCEGFYGYDYSYTGDFTRDVTSFFYRKDGNCNATPYTAYSNINFKPTHAGTYQFRFWNGGNNWIEKTIVVQ